MKIAVTTFGSEGDVRPYVALARGLRSSGHDAYLVAAKHFSPRATSVGVPFRDSGMRWDDSEVDAIMARVLADKNRLRQSKILFESVVELLRPAVAQVLDVTSDADLFVSHNVDICGYAASLRHKRPRIAGCLSAHTLPSRTMTPWGANLGPLNRLVSWLVRQTFASSTDAGFNELLRLAGLPAKKHVVLDATDNSLTTLVAVSPTLVPPDPLWAGQHHVTGFWFLDGEPVAPSPELRAFLDGGEPPVVVSFGSMSGVDAQAMTRTLVEGLTRLGRRAIIQGGWAGLGAGELPANIFRADYLPHAWLLPRAACLVHHGGIGTVAAALRAGIPQVVVWHYADQPDWGKLLARRGLAPAPISHRTLSSAWLARTLARTLDDAALRDRAQTIGRTVAAEDGVTRAVAIIDEKLRQSVAA